MQYPYLTFLWIVKLILTLFAGTAAVYYLLKLFKQKTKFLIVLKGIVLYEACAVLIHLVFSKLFVVRGFYTGGFVWALILTIVLFAVFYFITRKYFSVNIKKIIGCFLVLIFISLLFLAIFEQVEMKLWYLPPFASDRIKLDKGIEQIIGERGYGGYFMDQLFFGVQYQPPSFQILTKIQEGAFTWPLVRLFPSIFSSGLF